MPNETLPYEFHVTVEAASTKPSNFIKASRELGVKAIMLDLGVNVCADLTDYMTSSKGMLPSDKEAFDELDRIADGLMKDRFKVIRRKIETTPWHPNAPQEADDIMPEGCYFESHLAVSCRPDDVPVLREGLQVSADRLPLHLSQNKFKDIENGRIIMMATMRNYQDGFAVFSKVIDESQERISELGFDIAKKPITEFAMFDSNVHQDDAWMKAA